MTHSIDGLVDILSNNRLFKDFSKYQLDQIATLAEEVILSEGTYIIHENDIKDDIYIIEEGLVAIEKLDLTNNQIQQLTTLGSGEIIGEISVLDHEPRSASVKALKPTSLICLSMRKLRALSESEDNELSLFSRCSAFIKGQKIENEKHPIYSKIIQNLAINSGKRLRDANNVVMEALQRELENAKARVAMGILVITLLSILSLYVGVFKFIEEMNHPLAESSVVSIPLIFVFAIMVVIAMIKTGYPLRFYGLTTQNWQRSLFESLSCTFILMALTVGYKWVLIHSSVAFAHHALFDIKIHHDWWVLLGLLGYLLLVPFQELCVRGALQGSLEKLLVSPYRILWAILLSNLLFSLTHFHVSFGVALAVFIPGLMWGWLYSRHHTLIGVTLSHQIYGVWALMIVGVT